MPLNRDPSSSMHHGILQLRGEISLSVAASSVSSFRLRAASPCGHETLSKTLETTASEH